MSEQQAAELLALLRQIAADLATLRKQGEKSSSFCLPVLKTT